MNAKDIKLEDVRLHILVYGKSGVGKTYFACHFPKPYVFDFDNGMLSVRGKDVEFDTYEDTVRNGVFVESAWMKFMKKLSELEGKCEFETLVVDSVTTMEQYAMAHILHINKRKEPTLHEWGRLVEALQDLFKRMTKMAHHIIFVAHEEMVKDEVTGDILITPLIVGKVSNRAPLWFDEVYRLEVGRDKMGKPQHQFYTFSTLRFPAKSRLGLLQPIEVWEKQNPYELIMGRLKDAGRKEVRSDDKSK